MSNKKDKTEKQFIKLLAHFKSIDTDNQIIRGVVGSDDSLDRHGDRINPKGWDLDNFKKNPVILLNHDYQDLPIAKAINVKRNKNKLLFDIQFSKTYDRAVTAFNLIKEKILNAWSVGFLVLEWGNSGGDYTIEKQELLELSLVTVPANPNALSEEQKAMVKSLNDFKKEEKEEKTVKKEDNNRGKGKEKDAEESKKESKEKVKKEKQEKTDVKALIKDINQKIDKLEQDMDKRINDMEKQLEKQVNNLFTKRIDELLKVNENESDEDNANDETLLVLNSIREELKSDVKDKGKVLRDLKKLLNSKE